MFKFTFIKQTQSWGSSTDSHSRIRLQRRGSAGSTRKGFMCAVRSPATVSALRREVVRSCREHLTFPWFLNPHFPEGHFSRSQQTFLLMEFKGHSGSWPWRSRMHSCGPYHQHSHHSQQSMGLKNTKDNAGTNSPGALQPLQWADSTRRCIALYLLKIRNLGMWNFYEVPLVLNGMVTKKTRF